MGYRTIKIRVTENDCMEICDTKIYKGRWVSVQAGTFRRIQKAVLKQVPDVELFQNEKRKAEKVAKEAKEAFLFTDVATQKKELEAGIHAARKRYSEICSIAERTEKEFVDYKLAKAGLGSWELSPFLDRAQKKT